MVRPLLSVNNVEVIYDHVILVLKGVSLAVPEGGIVALLGANGAGKSTTLKAISGLLRTERGDVSKGSIEFLGESIKRSLLIVVHTIRGERIRLISARTATKHERRKYEETSLEAEDP